MKDGKDERYRRDLRGCMRVWCVAYIGWWSES